MGDCNCEWKFMIGAEDPTRSATTKAAKAKVASIRTGAWVSGTTHCCVHRPSYLPGVTTMRDDKMAIDAKPIDLIVVKRPLSVTLLPKQPGVKFVSCKLPRTLMKSLAWPSDHTSVAARVGTSDGSFLNVATWNCADPHYFAQFFPNPDFGFDWQSEPERFDAIEKHVSVLLQTASVVGLQEVPAALVRRLVALSARAGFEAQWVAAPSLQDTSRYDEVVGRSGRSTDRADAALAALDSLPPVAHDMLLCQYTSLRAEPPELEGSVAAALVGAPPAALPPAAAAPPAAARDASGMSAAPTELAAPAEQMAAVDIADSWEDEADEAAPEVAAPEAADSWEDLDDG